VDCIVSIVGGRKRYVEIRHFGNGEQIGGRALGRKKKGNRERRAVVANRIVLRTRRWHSELHEKEGSRTEGSAAGAIGTSQQRTMKKIRGERGKPEFICKGNLGAYTSLLEERRTGCDCKLKV